MGKGIWEERPESYRFQLRQQDSGFQTPGMWYRGSGLQLIGQPRSLTKQAGHRKVVMELTGAP